MGASALGAWSAFASAQRASAWVPRVKLKVGAFVEASREVRCRREGAGCRRESRLSLPVSGVVQSLRGGEKRQGDWRVSHRGKGVG